MRDYVLLFAGGTPVLFGYIAEDAERSLVNLTGTSLGVLVVRSTLAKLQYPCYLYDKASDTFSFVQSYDEIATADLNLLTYKREIVYSNEGSKVM